MGTLTDSATARVLMRAEWRELHAAMMFAQSKHANQVDKGGEPYVWHPMRVGISLLPDVPAAMLGLLHDVLEDTDATLEDVAPLLHNDAELLADLDALTHRKDGESYGAYIRRVRTRPRAAKVKMADLADNMNPDRVKRSMPLMGEENMMSLQLRYTLAVSVLMESE